MKIKENKKKLEQKLIELCEQKNIDPPVVLKLLNIIRKKKIYKHKINLDNEFEEVFEKEVQNED